MTAVVKSAVGKKKGRWRRGRRGEMGEENSHGAVTRVVAATRTMTIPFYFPHSLVSLAQVFDFYFSRRPCHFFNPREFTPSACAARGVTTKYHSPPEMYLNVFRDRAIHPYCSASSIGFQFFKGPPVVIYSR